MRDVSRANGKGDASTMPCVNANDASHMLCTNA
jgi:hypothetical protein